MGCRALYWPLNGLGRASKRVGHIASNDEQREYAEVRHRLLLFPEQQSGYGSAECA
jgi:hypothetical protein